MKKLILSLSLISTIAAFGQAPTLTSANIHAIGASHTYYVADSNAANLDAVTGAGVTWDYSTLQGYTTTVDNNIVDATTAPNAADFPTSTKADELQNNFMAYQNQVADTIFAQGYTFSEPSIGDVIVELDIDEAKVIYYSFNFGDSFSDSIRGTLTVTGGFPVSGDLEGEIVTSADGYGTLLLGTNTYADVLRVKIEENSIADLGILGTVPVIRTQYYYYQPGTQNFPVFIHTSLEAAGSTQNVVYSQDMLSIIGVEELNEVVDVNLYPNPVEDQLTVEMNSSANFDANIAVKDILGKVVYQTSRSVKKGTNRVEIDANRLQSGVYLVNITSGDSKITKKIIVK